MVSIIIDKIKMVHYKNHFMDNPYVIIAVLQATKGKIVE